ncbi:reverse transcriptase domain-containing protein, partial [Thiolapillus sp.]|uniref:reverse transcriptase domain-containing protein n=1 Tax=Thiolapillus sp. TaxID=2017437 RepID=UPI003AF4B072
MKPLLKKTTLNPEILKNYRPVSNLSFLSKILEKVVLRQLSNHLLTNNLFYSHQSAYRAGHSTETALLKIVNDLLSALDEDKVSLLSLLDLSAAFDTIDHSILLSRLSYSFGISDTVLAWFTSYLTDRIQTISVNGSKSLPAPLHYGVPKGSVLRPILLS